MNIVTKTISVANTGTISDNVKATITIPSSVSIQSFTPTTGTLTGKVWTINKMYDGETVTAKINLLVPNGFVGNMTVEVFGQVSEVDISDNKASTSLNTSDPVYCAPPDAECGQPTVSLLESFEFGLITGNMAINSCLSTKCLHRFSVANLVNVSNLEFNKTNGDFSLQPTNPFLSWSFDFRVQSYDCTVSIKGKTQFEADGPKTISGPALYGSEQLIDAIAGVVKAYDDRATADADVDLVAGEWFTVKDSTYPNQATLNVKL